MTKDPIFILPATEGGGHCYHPPLADMATKAQGGGWLGLERFRLGRSVIGVWWFLRELLRSDKADLCEVLEIRKQSELAKMEGDVSGWVSGGMEQNPAAPR